MKHKILMASVAMLISMAAIAGNSAKDKSCCTGGTSCVKACSSKCVCDSKKCTPATCKSKTCKCNKK